ncbi:hypothetical protein ACWIB8_04420 [Corynebacterium flavescens]
MSNPTPPNPFLEPEDSAGKKRRENPFAVPSQSPVPEYSPEPAYSVVPEVSEYSEPVISEADKNRGGKIYRFSWFRAVAAVFFLLVGISALDDPEIGTALFFLVPSAWYLLMSWNNRGEPKVPQKRYWPLVWIAAFVLLFFV